MITPAPSRLLALAGLLTWCVAGIPVLSRVAARGVPDLWAALPIGAWLVFGAAFALVAWEPECATRRRHVTLLALQTGAALTIVWGGARGVEMALLVMIAGQAPFLLPAPLALAWIVGQTLAMSVPWILARPYEGLLGSLAYFGFQAFALATGHLTTRESAARAELSRVHAELLATQSLLADGTRLAERLRISRELHDTLGHHLAALSVNLDLAARRTDGEAAAAIRQAHALARNLLHDVRSVVGTLRDEGAVDLAQALRSLAAGIPDPHIHLTLPDELRLRDPAQAHALFRCVQEAITNAVRHAAARNVWIELVRTPEGIEVRARDDGQGAAWIEPRAGLIGMRERLEAVGGRLTFQARPGDGFELTAFMPRAETA